MASDWSNDGPSQFTAQLLRDQAFRRDPIIDFSTPNGGSSGGGFSSGGSREPARLSDILTTIGLFLGLSVLISGVLVWPKEELLLAPLAGAAVGAPFFIGAWLLRLWSGRKMGSGSVGPWTVLLRWTMIGAALGISLGLATPALLGTDISVFEGLRVFAPAGAVLGLVIGIFRRPKKVKTG